MPLPWERNYKVSFKSPSVASEFDRLNSRLRDDALKAPDKLFVTSGKRDSSGNKTVGGVPNSYHLTGDALDLRRSETTADDLSYFKSKGYKVIDEGDHYHIEPQVAQGESKMPLPWERQYIKSSSNTPSPNSSNEFRTKSISVGGLNLVDKNTERDLKIQDEQIKNEFDRAKKKEENLQDPLAAETSKLYTIAAGGIPDIEEISTKIKGGSKLIAPFITDRDAYSLQKGLSDRILRLRSGGAFTKDEDVSYLISLIPQMLDSKEEKLKKLGRLEAEFRTLGTQLAPADRFEASINEIRNIRKKRLEEPSDGSVPFKSENSDVLDSPFIGAIAGANRLNPAKNIQNAVAGSVVDLLGGQMPSKEGFQKHYRQSKGMFEEAEKRSPIAAGAGEIAASIPTYVAGGEIMGLAPWLRGAKGATGLAQAVARGSGSSMAVGQLERGLKVDPKASAIDAGLGAGGELLGAGLGKVVEKGKGVPKWMMNKVFKPSAEEVESRALYGAPTLGEQVLQRGLSGSGDDFIRMAASGKKEAGQKIDDIISVFSGEKIDKTKAADAMQKILKVAEESGDEEAAAQVRDIMTSFWKRGNMTAGEAQKMKVALGKQMKTYYENPYKLEPTKVKAQLAKTSGLRKSLEEKAQSKGLDLGKANADYGFWADLGDVSRKVATKEAGGSAVPLQQQISGLTGLGLYGPGEGLAALSGTQMAKSPKYLSKGAVTLNDILELLGKANGFTPAATVSGVNQTRGQ